MARNNLFILGYRPDFHCKAPPNVSTAIENTTVRHEYKDCSIVTYTNRSNDVTVSSSECTHGWEYSIPTDQSFVTEVGG